MREGTEWWGTIQMRPHVSPEMVADSIAGVLGRTVQERLFPAHGVIDINQEGPGDDPAGFRTYVDLGTICLDVCGDDFVEIQKAMLAMVGLASETAEPVAFCLLEGEAHDGYVYRYDRGRLLRAGAEFRIIHPPRWKAFETADA